MLDIADEMVKRPRDESWSDLTQLVDEGLIRELMVQVRVPIGVQIDSQIVLSLWEGLHAEIDRLAVD
ncbi:MAG: hypothetical protein ACLQVF_40870 [Isosphaeraceae bacterium]